MQLNSEVIFKDVYNKLIVGKVTYIYPSGNYIDIKTDNWPGCFISAQKRNNFWYAYYCYQDYKGKLYKV